MGTFVDIPSQHHQGVLSLGSPAEYITEHMDQASFYAEESFEITQQYADALTSILNDLEIPDTSDINVDTVDIPEMVYDTRPELSDIDLPNDWPENNAIPPTWLEIPDFTPVTIPTLEVVPPSWSNPDVPIADDIDSPGDAPVLSEIITPTAPSIILPSPPSLDDITIPEAPSIALPEFEGEMPSATIDEPAPFVWGEPVYSSGLWSDLFSKILDGIQNGGTGLDATVEAEIYQRLLDRQVEENERLYTEATDYFAARGFSLPPGALIGKLTEIQNQISRNNSAASREITINQAELAQKNTHFILDKGVELEGMLRDFYTKSTNRLFEANKILAENAISVYNALVEKHNIDVKAYEIESRVYESRVRAALTEIEIFKGQIEASRVTSDIQRNLIDIYKSQISAAEAQMNLYVSEMEGAKIASTIELSKLERFKLETQAYIARLDGEKAKFSLYEIQVKAEGVKANTYGEQVRAYATSVTAAEAQIDAQIKQSQVYLEQNKMEILRYQTELEAYTTETRAKLAETQAIVSGFEAETSAYNAETQAISSMYGTKIKEIQAKIEEAQLNMQKAVAEVEAVTTGYEAIKKLQIEGTTGIMNVGAQLTASALNAVNTSASYGYSSSESLGESWGHSESISESHPFVEHE